ncbi:uncharacterized protein [Palaemon carinicauda]|uniref:uncharacterized protein n=1 Tax=Palaemon carinicauda TaxID=392227 RepID=UPI0035B5926D
MSSIQPQPELEKSQDPEEPPQSFQENSESDDEDSTFLDSRQKKIFSHPQVQKILQEHLKHNLKAYEQDMGEDLNIGLDDEVPSFLHKSFIPPQIFASMGVDLEALGKATDNLGGKEFEEKLEYLVKSQLEKFRGKELDATTDNRKAAAWHPMAAFKHAFDDIEEW